MQSVNNSNFRTLWRIEAIPLVMACFWLDLGWSEWLSMSLFVAAGITDYFDGYIARRYHQISRLGRFLDPIADKVLTLGGFLALVSRGDVWWLPVALMAARERWISIYRVGAGKKGISLPAAKLGKDKAARPLLVGGGCVGACGGS